MRYRLFAPIIAVGIIEQRFGSFSFAGREVGLVRGLAVLILLCNATFSTGCRGHASDSRKRGEMPQASVSNTAVRIFTVADGDSSFLYVQPATGKSFRLTTRKSGWETDGVISPSGDAVAYAVADGPEAKSEVWVSRIDGGHAHRVSTPEEDALMPAFAPDGKTLLYVKSRFNGHYSSIARPRRHKFDVVKVVVDPEALVAGATPVELTQQEFFDLRSLSASPDGERFLVSTSGYPIGDLIEEFEIANPVRVKRIFQPHVPSEPSAGAVFGEAAYTNDGMGVVFTAATDGKNGMFDYNVYQMSDVTGGDLVQLTHRSGMIDEMNVSRDGTIFFSSGGQLYSIDPHTRQLQQN